MEARINTDLLKWVWRLDWCCDDHRRHALVSISALLDTEAAEPRPCLICESPKNLTVNFAVPAGVDLTKDGGELDEPEPKVAIIVYTLCPTCEKLPALGIRACLELEMKRDLGGPDAVTTH